AKNGWMTAAIDSVTFGGRAIEDRFRHDEHTDWEKAPGATYAGPDGINDGVGEKHERNGSFDLFGGLEAIGAIRDQFRQAALDTAQLVRVLRSDPDLSPLKTTGTDVKVDPAHIAYVGDSLGG